MKTTFAWGLIFGVAIGVILLGHNGILTDCGADHEGYKWHGTESTIRVSPQMIYIPGGCVVDWPQYALVCTYTDVQGNRIRHTRCCDVPDWKIITKLDTPI